MSASFVIEGHMLILIFFQITPDERFALSSSNHKFEPTAHLKKSATNMEICLPSVEISSGFSVVADATVQPNVDINCVILFDSDAARRDLYEQPSLFDSKGSNLLLMMTCLDVMILPTKCA